MLRQSQGTPGSARAPPGKRCLYLNRQENLDSPPMAPKPETPNPETPTVTTPPEDHKCTGTFVIFSIIVGIAFVIAQDAGNPQSNWANHLGNGLACGTLAVATAAIILVFALGFPKDRTAWRVFISKMAAPMIFTGFFWLWRTTTISEEQAERGRYAKLVEETMSEQALRKQEADPVIRMAKIVLDDRIRKSISMVEGSIKIDGWSASSLDGGTWLVKFEYSANGVNQWFLYEYNDYLRDFKSVFEDESIKSHYLNIDSSGASFNEATRRKMGDWYGPVR